MTVDLPILDELLVYGSRLTKVLGDRRKLFKECGDASLYSRSKAFKMFIFRCFRLHGVFGFES
jgi:hypothetical protein